MLKGVKKFNLLQVVSAASVHTNVIGSNKYPAGHVLK